ncbi:hypothetical protein VPH35_102875 [Triticum aestivum]|uniref:F-box domain-containing protein n=3 Tax=Triticum TaxID=4564 RepID=A0A9R0XTQ2_TRITD|nr:uncharacterized protein LOC123129372 [Triticum aestivum]VAI42261.1 unnamed protein product [Triticum turgidum subsp. durum]
MSSPRWPAATPPLEDEDLLTEILLRLPPQPSSLPRASLVCRQWCCLISDPRFVRRFRRRYRRNPPLVGFFDMGPRSLYFVPTLEDPNRVPPERFALQFEDGDQFMPLGSRHGLVFVIHLTWSRVLVWDPVTADQHLIALPPGLMGHLNRIMVHGAVLRAAGEAQHFQVVLMVADDDYDMQDRQMLACVYSSKTGVWGDIISAPLPPKVPIGSWPLMVSPSKEAVLVDNSLHWMLFGSLVGILEFDLLKQSIAVIPTPVGVVSSHGRHELTVVRAKGGGLGFLIVIDFCAQSWRRKTDCHGVASWELERTIELDKLLPLNPEMRAHLYIVGFAEENNVVFMWTSVIGLFLIHLESLQFKKIPHPSMLARYLPFESVFIAETCVGGGHDGAVAGGQDRGELLLNTSIC